MKIILFGGAELGEAEKELKMIGKVINRVKPKQVLHIPFARTSTNEAEWKGDYFGRNIKLAKGIKYLNAALKNDLAKAANPLVFMSGGSNVLNLSKKLKANPRLVQLIKKSSWVIGESAGAKVLGEYFRAKGKNNTSAMVRGLGIIKGTVIEPHYTQRQRQGLLIEDMAEAEMPCGLGIDSMTAIEFEASQFPEKIKRIGRGRVEIKLY